MDAVLSWSRKDVAALVPGLDPVVPVHVPDLADLSLVPADPVLGLLGRRVGLRAADLGLDRGLRILDVHLTMQNNENKTLQYIYFEL